MNWLRKALVVALCVMTLAACAKDEPSVDSTPVQPQHSKSTDEPAGEPEVPKSLRFAADTVDGQSFDAKELAGKDAVLWFWAPWCSECRREAPHVAAVQKSVGDDVTFVGVAGLGPVKDMKAFVSDYRVGAFSHLADVKGKVWRRFGVVQQPAHAFIDDDGSVKLVRGELDRKGLIKHVDNLTAN